MNKVALITGASQGIGQAIALQMAKEGYDIVINYIGDDTPALDTAKQCEDFGVKTLCINADVTDFAAVEAMVKSVLEVFGQIDVLVNNSGITKDTLMLRMSEQDFDAVIDVNLKGTWNCIKHVLKPMMKQRSGSIISMASVIGLIGNVGQANYAASKAGIIGLTKSVAREVAPRGITVNAIAPGFITTKMTEVLSDDVKQAILTNIPMKDFGTMEDVANMVSFLASDKSRYVTGQVLHVDGGMVM
ncbi:beta-ketoacyl-ACP reductase [Erysipelotrichaceae bacterium MTC7]|nr:beta-ketoacyl-ACP reductase [Erysipelotrichaceae bacterium MTC7]